jgi:hypothetical protein
MKLSEKGCRVVRHVGRNGYLVVANCVDGNDYVDFVGEHAHWLLQDAVAAADKVEAAGEITIDIEGSTKYKYWHKFNYDAR